MGGVHALAVPTDSGLLHGRMMQEQRHVFTGYLSVNTNAVFHPSATANF